jgi:hypothetical protein
MRPDDVIRLFGTVTRCNQRVCRVDRTGRLPALWCLPEIAQTLPRGQVIEVLKSYARTRDCGKNDPTDSQDALKRWQNRQVLHKHKALNLSASSGPESRCWQLTGDGNVTLTPMVI